MLMMANIDSKDVFKRYLNTAQYRATSCCHVKHKLTGMWRSYCLTEPTHVKNIGIRLNQLI